MGGFGAPKVASPFSFSGDSWGAWEVLARYSNTDLNWNDTTAALSDGLPGIAGGEEKCRHIVEELGFDAAIDYKSENVLKGLRQHCPNGIDVYFDNVGGEILDAALACLARGARIPLCGPCADR